MQVIRREGVFKLFERHATLILTDEKQLQRIVDHPDKPLFDDEDKGFSGETQRFKRRGMTLDSFMKDAHDQGCVRVEVSYDFFFGGSKRENYPDSPLTVKAFKVIHDYAAKYGMDFGASLISPLDLGGGYVMHNKDRGYTWQFEECAVDRGSYSITLRRQRQWYNNKGPISLEVSRVMAYAFDEKPADNGRDLYVPIETVTDISDTVKMEVLPETYELTQAGYAFDLMTVSGKTDCGRGRALVIVEYATPEQDYFADNAESYIRSVIDLHADNGIRYQGFYSDEMHIQFDWDLTKHFGPTEIRTRYVTDSLIEAYSDRYGKEYRDFAKYMVYFAYTEHEDGHFRSHMMGPDEDGAYRTILFRKRYFELLSGRVVQLSCAAKAYAESRYGSPIMTRAHATWQESPTCDHFSEEYRFSEENSPSITHYDYDKPYVWSSTIRENVSACGDYFRWNEFLTGNGTDHPEGGNADRDYYAEAFASSLGALNPFDSAYCGSWGSPAEVLRRLHDVSATYGCGPIEHSLAQDLKHRVSDVLLLYPNDLNYAEERFGSWMVQYGYCDYITEEMLIKWAEPSNDGLLHVRGRKYRALVSLFEAFIDPRTARLLTGFVKAGGRVIWTGPAALRYTDGTSAEKDFLKFFGLKSCTPLSESVRAEDGTVRFSGILKGVPDQKILTGMLPDALYPITPDKGTETVAVCGENTVGTLAHSGDGVTVCLGFRPRDDQSQSTGEDVATLFEILNRLGAYGPDSLEAVSRSASARYIMNRFPNGCVTVANHYRTFEENWYGSFFRDKAKDKELLKGRKLPPVRISLNDRLISGHKITYSGSDALSFRVDADGMLAAFVGDGTLGITVDGHEYAFSSEPANIAYAVIAPERLAACVRSLILFKADKPGVYTLPCPAGFKTAKAGVCDMDYFETDKPAEIAFRSGKLALTVDKASAGKWIAVSPEL